MNYYKDQDGSVYAYDDEQTAMGLAGDKTPMTTEEIEAHTNPPKTAEFRAFEITARLAQIDAESVRPLRALMTDTSIAKDSEKLAALDAAAAALRVELAGLRAELIM